ncbi:MAG: FtsQ-type POTRA domain-containing protein [Oscillospiraceae bacterium]|nr:FtsQ-type POTRA domain-containing protein [Oscillospiraceae bacterium]
MEHDNNRRPAERGRAAVTREKPRTPASRPRDSRPRTGSASTREAERRERMRSPEQTRTRSPEQTRSRDAAPARDRGTARQTRSAAAERQAPARDRAAAKAARKQADERKRQQADERKRQQAEQRKRRQAEQRQRQRTEEPEPEAAKKHRKKKPHRVYNTNFGFKFVTMLAVVAVIVLSMVIFFKVKHIEVVFTGVEPAVPVPLETTAPPVSEAASLASGETAPTGTGELPTGEGETAAPETEGGETAPSETEAPETAQPTPPETAPALVEGHSCYTAGDIIKASGIHLDDNLLSLSKATVASRIHAALPYVNEIQIKIQFPGTVVITVSEFEVTYGIQDETGGWWLMSREGRILEAASEQAVRSHLVVTGMPIQVPQPGDWLKPSAADGADLSEIAAKQKVILELIPALEQTPFAKEIVRVDVSTSYDLTLWYGTRYEIRLGTVEELDYKLRFLEAALEEKEIQRRSGTIDLTFNEDKKAHFMEFQ